MKLLIKANNKGLKVDGGGNTKELFAVLVTAIYRLLVSVSKNEQGFHDAKKILISSIQAMRYDGTTDNELFRKLMQDEH